MYTRNYVDKVFKRLQSAALVKSGRGKNKEEHYESIICFDKEMLGGILGLDANDQLRWALIRLIKEDKISVLKIGGAYLIDIIPF